MPLAVKVPAREHEGVPLTGKGVGNGCGLAVASAACLLLAACGGSGSSSRNPMGTLSASPESCVIAAGEERCSSTLTWSSSDTDTACVFTGAGERLDCGIGASATVDIESGDNSFLLKDGDSFDDRTLATVEVAGIDAPWVEVAFDPPAVVQGEPATLTWNSGHAIAAAAFRTATPPRVAARSRTSGKKSATGR